MIEVEGRRPEPPHPGNHRSIDLLVAFAMLPLLRPPPPSMGTTVREYERQRPANFPSLN